MDDLDPTPKCHLHRRERLDLERGQRPIASGTVHVGERPRDVWQAASLERSEAGKDALVVCQARCPVVLPRKGAPPKTQNSRGRWFVS